MNRSVLLFSLVFLCTAAARSSPHTGPSSPRTDTVLVARTFVGTVGTIAAQTVVGMMGGLGGMLLSQVHPVVGGIGWVIGSSFGVFSIGDAGTGRGNYWWTFGSGAVVVIAFAPWLAEGGLVSAFAAVGAMVGSLVAEIVAYHISEASPGTRTRVTVLPSVMLTSTPRTGEGIPTGALNAVPAVRVSIGF